MGFSRQEYWSGLPCPPPGDLLKPRIEPSLLQILYCLNNQGKLNKKIRDYKCKPSFQSFNRDVPIAKWYINSVACYCRVILTSRCRRGWQHGSHSEKNCYSNAPVKSSSYKVIASHQLQEGWSSSGWPFLSSWRRGQEGRKERRQHLGAPSFHSWVQLPLDAHSWQGPEEESREETCTAPCNRSATLHALES